MLTRRRKRRLESIKRDMLNMWTIFKRLPMLVLYFSCMIGGIAIIGYILSIIFLSIQN